jgi:hypothetical protein
MRIFNPSIDSLSYVFNYNLVEASALRGRTYETLTLDDLRRFAHRWKHC